MTALWAYTGPPDAALDRRLSDVLRHRGHLGAPGGEGIVRAPQVTVGVSLRRPLRALGGIATADNTTLTMAIAGRLPGDTTVSDVLATYRRRGEVAVHELGGEWIIAVVDGARLTVWRDVAGVRTVYWGRSGNRVIVAIEPKAVVSAPGFPRRVDPGALAQYLTFGFVPGERCAVEGLHELAAGHRLEIDVGSGTTKVVRWFFHERIEPIELTPANAVEVVRSAVQHAVATRLPPDEPVAAFVSGGLDSAIVASVAAAEQRARGAAPPLALSVHFGLEHPNEVAHARAVARHCGLEHQLVEMSGSRIEPMLRTLIWHLDEPIGDPVTIGNLVLAQAAARHAPWVLNGEGGDPLFGGPKNLPMLLAHWYPTMAGPNARERQYLATWRRAGEEVANLLHPDLLADVDVERDLIAVVKPYFDAPRPVDLLNKLMVANMRLKGAHLILPKVDRVLGAYGLTPLSPLFDAELLALSLQLPPTTKLRAGVEKWVLKEAFRNLLPASIVDRQKSGMRVPVQRWFRDDLRGLAWRLLSPAAAERAGIFNADRVRDVLDYRTGRDGLRLWMLVTFELWRRLVIEGEAP
jgi:asparagine synthase (glutamine-hydrolysing)